MGSFVPQFLAPIMLYGAAAVSIPVIIHLLNRRRIKIVHWAAMDFLKDIMKKSRRVLRLKDLILLLIRTLALLLLVLGMSRIACIDAQSWSGTGADVGDAIFVFDTSYSMGYVVGSESLFDRAKKAALRIRKSYDTGSRIQILTVGADATPLFKDGPTGDLAQVDKAIEGLRVGSGRSEMKHLLRAAADEVPDLHHGRQDVYVFTDMQAAMWRFSRDDPVFREAEEKLGRVSGVFFIDCSLQNAQNVAIAHLDLPDGVATTDTPTQFTARIANTGTDPRDNVHLGLRVYGLGAGAGEPEVGPTGAVVRGEESLWRADATFAAAQRIGGFLEAPTIPVGGQGVTVEFEPYLFPRAGSYLVEVFLQNHDNLERDDSRFLALNVRDHVKILCIEGDRAERPGRGRVGDTFYFRRVLAPFLKTDPDKRFPYRPVTMTADDANRYDWTATGGTNGSDAAPDNLGQYAVVVIANVRDLKAEFVAALERFVGAGGALFVFLGENVDAESATYADLLYRRGLGLMPARLKNSFGVRFQMHKHARDLFTLDTSQDQLADVMFQTGNNLLTRRATFSKPLFTKAWQLELPGPAAAPNVVDGLAGDGATYRVGPPEVVARFLRGSVPFAVRRTFGKGHVILFNTSCDAAWSTLPYSAAFFMYRAAVRDLVARTAGRLDRRVGEKLIYEVPAPLVAEGNMEFVFTGPRGDSEERVAAAAGKDPLGHERYVIEVEPALTRLPGLYHFAPAGAPARSAGERYFAANVDPAESALAPMETDAAAAFFDKLKDKVLFARYPADLETVMEKKRAVHEYSPAMLVMAFCLLVIETAAAAAMAPRSAAEPAAPGRPGGENRAP